MSNYRELSAHFKQYRSRVTRNTKEAMKSAARKMTAEMRATVPVDTGTLKRSIRFRGPFNENGHYVVRIYANAESKGDKPAKYAEFIEFGTGIYNEHGDGRTHDLPWTVTAVVHGKLVTWKTKGMRAQPFIRPAFRKYAPELQQMIQQSMRVDGGKIW